MCVRVRCGRSGFRLHRSVISEETVEREYGVCPKLLGRWFAVYKTEGSHYLPIVLYLRADVDRLARIVLVPSRLKSG